MTKMDKQYIEKEYEQAIKEYNAALTEDDLDTARRTMKRLEAIAMQDYGFDYADELAMKKEACLPCINTSFLPYNISISATL